MKPDSCLGCPCHKMGSDYSSVEVGSRYASTRLMVIAEASGEHEAREGLPLRPHAQSGSLFADALREAGISRSEIAISNVLRCRPKNDWLEGAPYAYAAINQCVATNLTQAIAELKPRVILALGGTSFRVLTEPIKGRSGTLDIVRGYAIAGAGAAEGIPVVPTYHPSHIRRGATHLTPLLYRDLKRAFLMAIGKLKEGEHFFLSPPKLNYQTAPSVREAAQWLQNVDPERTIYADLETPRSRREDEDERNSFAERDINMIQFTQHRGHGIALPWRDEYIEIAKAILALPNRKTWHNGLGFDLPVLAANGVTPAGIQDDTMVLWKCYQADLPANLQAVAGYCGFPFKWKDLSETDPEYYGCCDVDATCWADETLQTLLKREDRWSSYEKYFRDFWPILRDMSNRGIPISEPARSALKSTLEIEGIRVDAEVKALVPPEVLATKQKYGYKRNPRLRCLEEGCDYEGRGDHLCSGTGLATPYPVLAESHNLVQREIIVREQEKCRCTKKTRADCDVCAGVGFLPAGLVEQRWASPVSFNPNSAPQVKRFMRFLKHPIPKHAKRVDESGEAAETTEVKELERLYAKTKHPIYPLLIQRRQLTKVESTYVEGWKPNRDGRVRSTFTFTPATFQLGSREPNVQNGIKHGKSPFQRALVKGFNGMICATEGHRLVNIDAKSFHAQTTACEFGLPDYLRLAKIDIHSFVTCHYLKLPERIGLYDRPDEEMREIFKRLKKDETFKFTRDYKAKRTILGIQFAMFYRKLYQLNPDDFENENEAKKLWELIMIELWPGLKKGQDRQRKLAAEQKFLQSRYGALRRFYDVERWDRQKQRMVGGDQAEAAVAFCPAANAFGYFRSVMLRMREQGWDERYQLINSVHDSLVFHCPENLVEECIHNVTQEVMKPAPEMVFAGVTDERGLSVEAEASVGMNQAEMEEVK